MPFETAGLTVDRDSDRPLHAQVGEAIHRQVRGRTLLPGEALPSEAELQRVFGVARSVVRQALAGLAELGAVERTQGRITLVAPWPEWPRSEWHRQAQRAGGLRPQFAARGQALVSRVVSFAAAPAPPEVGDEVVGDGWRIERRRCVAEVPVAFADNWVPRSLFPGLRPEQLDGAASLHEVMRVAGHHPVGGRRQVQAVAADDRLAAELDVPVGAPLLLLEGVTRDARGRGLEWFRVWHPSRTVFDIDAEVTAGPPAGGRDLAELRETARQLSNQVDALNRRLAGM